MSWSCHRASATAPPSIFISKKSRFEDVLGYFVSKAANAYAESLNAKIKDFRARLKGVSDVKFFLYRLSLIFG